jgi:hypothetical protein
MFRKLPRNDTLALVVYGVLLFGLPLAWVGNAFIHGQRPFEAPIPVSAAILSR